MAARHPNLSGVVMNLLMKVCVIMQMMLAIHLTLVSNLHKSPSTNINNFTLIRHYQILSCLSL